MTQTALDALAEQVALEAVCVNIMTSRWPSAHVTARRVVAQRPDLYGRAKAYCEKQALREELEATRADGEGIIRTEKDGLWLVTLGDVPENEGSIYLPPEEREDAQRDMNHMRTRQQALHRRP